MKSLAVTFFQSGFNCSQSILKAAEIIYKIKVPDQSFNMCKGVGSGFGAGNFCCALVGGIMVFGLMFDETSTKCMRIRLLDLFYQKYRSTHCAILTKKMNENCEQIIADVAEMTQEIIKEFS